MGKSAGGSVVERRTSGTYFFLQLWKTSGKNREKNMDDHTVSEPRAAHEKEEKQEEKKEKKEEEEEEQQQEEKEKEQGVH